MSRAADAAAAAVDPDEVLRFARALIAAPSRTPAAPRTRPPPSPPRSSATLDASPRTIRSDAGRPSVLAAIGSGGRPRLAWNGHLDVVPAGAPDTWRTGGPWAGEVVDGRLVGRGAADMKGPVAAALAATAAIRRAGVELAGTFELHLAADEELAGIHGTQVLWDRGLLDQDAAIVGEPSELRWASPSAAGRGSRRPRSGRPRTGRRPTSG